jgi:23S rRNA G2445 N2-methylase RlmL
MSSFAVRAARAGNLSVTRGGSVADVPWGRRHGSYKAMGRLYPQLFREWWRVLAPNGRLYLLTLERKVCESVCDSVG